MKKILYFISTFLALTLPIGAVAFSYVIQPGDTLSKLAAKNSISVQELADANNIQNPDHIFAGKTLEIPDGELVGGSGGTYTPVTGYQSRLSVFLSSSASTINVASTKDPAGNQISISDVSSSSSARIYLNIAPGTSKEEIIYCTGVTATAWTGCVRGLSFQGGSMSASTTLAFAHNAGSAIVISNVGQFYTEYVSRTGNQDVYDIKTFYSYPKFAVTTTVPVLASEFATKYYVDNVGAGGFTAANVSTTRGLSVDSSIPERVGINASTTRALAFDSDGKIYVNASTTQGLTFGTSGDLRFDPARNFNFTGSVTATNLSVPYSTASSSAISYGVLQDRLFGNGSDGAFSLSSGDYHVLNTAGKYVYQYTSFSITGNSSLATGSNLNGHPLSILVQGDLTITSASTTAITRVGAGSTGAAGGAGGGSGTAAGTIGTAPDYSQTAFTATAPTAGAGGVFAAIGRAGGGGGGGAGFGNAGITGNTSGGGGAAGAGGAKEAYLASAPLSRFISLCHMGGGGAGGGGGSSNGGVGGTGGTGGTGGGCIQFIVGGNINVTSTVSVAGTAGSAGTAGGAGGGGSAGGAGGGGGGGGYFGIYYAGNITANTGTYTVTGGSGGSGGAGNGTGESGPTGGAGGDGQSVVRKISSFIGL